MSKKHKVALITDSTCDIPSELIEQYDILWAPLYLIWGTEQFKDKVEIDSEGFYTRLARDPVHPTTSQPTPKDFIDIFEKVKAEGAEEAVVVAISDRLSGTLDSVHQACDMVDFPVTIHDSRSISMGLGWQVLAAARAREAGADAAAMVEAAENVRQHLDLIFTVDTLDYLHKGGRIGAAAKLLGTALQLKPQLRIDPEVGIVEPGEKVRTRKKSLDSVFNVFKESMAGNTKIKATVLHISAEEEAQAMAERLKANFDCLEVIVTDTSPVIGVHGGPGTVGIAGYYVTD